MTNWLQAAMNLATKQKGAKKYWLDGYFPIFIYGTGTFAQDVHYTLVENGLPVFGYLDHIERNPQLLNGMPIYSPEKADQMHVDPEKAIVVLAIHNYQADIHKIITHLTAAGFRNILTSVELYDFFGRELGVRYWLTNRDFYLPLRTILEEMHQRWADEASQSLFQAVMEFRLTGDVTKLPPPDLINPYHPRDLPAWEAPLRFVDCGAFDGDTLTDFLKNKISIESVAAFEPDLANYAKLAQLVASHKTQFRAASLFPCGVYSTTRQLAFQAGQGMASGISSKGTTVIQCVTLDEAIPTFAPNLIKMDIEGAEYDALLGAYQIITTHTPGLAISVYHRPEHLWQLPLLVESMTPRKYQFYLRSHALNDFELILYAIPRESQE